MRLKHRQRGMGMFNLSYVLITLAIFGYIGLKLIPVYLESINIKRAVEAVAQAPGASSKTARALIDDMIKRLDIDNVTRITKRNWKDTVTITKRAKKVNIIAAYDVSVPLFYNLSITASFAFKGESP